MGFMVLFFCQLTSDLMLVMELVSSALDCPGVNDIFVRVARLVILSSSAKLQAYATLKLTSAKDSRIFNLAASVECRV